MELPEAPDAEQKSAASDDPKKSVGFSDMAGLLTLTLIGISGLCIGLSARFRILYQRDNRLLAAPDHPNQEATP
jgi:hypothetical protein